MLVSSILSNLNLTVENIAIRIVSKVPKQNLLLGSDPLDFLSKLSDPTFMEKIPTLLVRCPAITFHVCESKEET